MPPKVTAGLARSRVRGYRRSPAPPASKTPSVSLMLVIPECCVPQPGQDCVVHQAAAPNANPLQSVEILAHRKPSGASTIWPENQPSPLTLIRRERRNFRSCEVISNSPVDVYSFGGAASPASSRWL